MVVERKGGNGMKYLTKEEKRVAILDLLSEFDADVVIDTLVAYISLDSCVELYHDLENEGHFGEEEME